MEDAQACLDLQFWLQLRSSQDHRKKNLIKNSISREAEIQLSTGCNLIQKERENQFHRAKNRIEIFSHRRKTTGCRHLFCYSIQFHPFKVSVMICNNIIIITTSYKKKKMLPAHLLKRAGKYGGKMLQLGWLPCDSAPIFLTGLCVCVNGVGTTPNAACCLVR